MIGELRSSKRRTWGNVCSLGSGAVGSSWSRRVLETSLPTTSIFCGVQVGWLSPDSRWLHGSPSIRAPEADLSSESCCYDEPAWRRGRGLGERWHLGGGRADGRGDPRPRRHLRRNRRGGPTSMAWRSTSPRSTQVRGGASRTWSVQRATAIRRPRSSVSSIAQTWTLRPLRTGVAVALRVPERIGRRCEQLSSVPTTM